jgi:hypothetical protein
MKRFNGTIEYVNSRRAIVALTDSHGNWQGAQRIDLARAKHGKQALYELGYAAASTMATIKDGMLETFKELGK